MKELKQFNKIQAEITEFVKGIPELIVSSQAMVVTAQKHGSTIKEMLKRIEMRRKELTVPLDEEKKEIMAFVAEISAPLLAAEVHLKREVQVWNDTQERVKREEMEKLEIQRMADRKLEEARYREDAKVFGKAMVEQSHIKREVEHHNAIKDLSAPAVSGIKKIWKHELEDITKVPKQYLLLDDVKVRRANLNGEVIPGVRSWQESNVSFGRSG